MAEVLGATDIELDRQVIAREGLVEARAASAADSPAVTTAGVERAEGEPPLASLRARRCRPWRQGLPVMVLAPDRQRTAGVLEQFTGVHGSAP
ncbi:hypothetical protein ABZ924_08875 [Streptomyces sp. NPDC046876]|uniref:hypothetical protein n=1 Tax=Streptomyces sp. NPDC046876 TaxID=3155616 RepID=UPI0033EB536E